MMKLWTFFWGHHNWAFFGGVGGEGVILYIYILFRAFSEGQSSELEYFWGVLYVKYFWGMPDVPDIFLGVNSR